MEPPQPGVAPPEDEQYYRNILRQEQDERRHAEERLQQVLAEAQCERTQHLEEERRVWQELAALKEQVARKEKLNNFEKAMWKSVLEQELVATQNDRDRMRRQVRGHVLCQRSLMKEVAALLPRLRGFEDRQVREQPMWGSRAPIHRQSERTVQLLKSLADREGQPEPVPYLASPLKLESGGKGPQVRCLFTGAALSSGSQRPRRRSSGGSSSVPDLKVARQRSRSPSPSSAPLRATSGQQHRRAHSGPPIVRDHGEALELFLAMEALPLAPPPLPPGIADSEDALREAAEAEAAEEELRAYVRHMQAYARQIHVTL